MSYKYNQIWKNSKIINWYSSNYDSYIFWHTSHQIKVYKFRLDLCRFFGNGTDSMYNPLLDALFPLALIKGSDIILVPVVAIKKFFVIKQKQITVTHSLSMQFNRRARFSVVPKRWLCRVSHFNDVYIQSIQHSPCKYGIQIVKGRHPGRILWCYT